MSRHCTKHAPRATRHVYSYCCNDMISRSMQKAKWVGNTFFKTTTTCIGGFNKWWLCCVAQRSGVFALITISFIVVLKTCIIALHYCSYMTAGGIYLQSAYTNFSIISHRTTPRHCMMHVERATQTASRCCCGAMTSTRMQKLWSVYL